MRHLTALLLLAATGPAVASTGGLLDTLPRGSFNCELPGDANGAVGQPAPQASFYVMNGSSYSTDAGEGSYLLTGDTVVMTSGPLQGAKYHRMTDRFLRVVDADGNQSRLRCVLGTPNNNR